MSKQREEFEAWFRREVNPNAQMSRQPEDNAYISGEYVSMLLEDRWKTWQASRAAALEEAALAAEQYPNPCGHAPWAAHTVDMTCVEIGSAIRALKEQQ